MRVLIVDGEHSVRHLLAQIFQKAGYDAIHTVNGEQAFALIVCERQAGANAYLTKPVFLSQLMTDINAIQVY